MKTLLYKVAIILGILSIAPVLVASAQVNTAVTTDASVTATTPAQGASVRARVTASSTAEVTRAERAKTKGEQEIDRRTASLNQLLTRVGEVKKITAEFKAALTTNIQNQIASLTTLRAKIDADTDLSTLKTDIKSVTDSYRIYLLVVPVTRITAAADRIATIINMMNSVGVKLQARINTAKASGADTTALEASLADLATKLQSSQTHAQAAITAVATLTPDNGDQTLRQSNEAAIKTGQAEIKAGTAALVDARKDIAAVVSGLGKLKVNANATSSVSTQ